MLAYKHPSIPEVGREGWDPVECTHFDPYWQIRVVKTLRIFKLVRLLKAFKAIGLISLVFVPKSEQGRYMIFTDHI
jgi:hypothetical protein